MRKGAYFQLIYSTNVRIMEGDIAGDFSEGGWKPGCWKNVFEYKTRWANSPVRGNTVR
jgi:hypothetical protein